MKAVRYILVIVALLLGRVEVGFSQDIARLGERSIMGTARYVGMGGAMTAIGGDPSAVHDNPAGLGIYQHTEVLISFDQTIDKTWQVGTSNNQRRYLTMIPQASVIWSSPASNFMFSYRRLHTYGRTLRGVGVLGHSLGNELQYLDVKWDIPFCTDRFNAMNSLSLQESGMVNEFNFAWGMSISHQWYIGAGLQIQSYDLISEALYQEDFVTTNLEGQNMYIDNKSSLSFHGVSASLSAGLIFRPIRCLRFGLGFQTNSLGSISTYTSGRLTALTDSVRVSTAPDQGWRETSKAIRPFHLSTSMAFQFSAYGLLALQYDLYHQPKQPFIHSLRAGLEIIPVMGMYINAGYVCESTFKRVEEPVAMDPTFNRQDTYFIHPRMSQYASFAIGYRGTYMLVQAAYQYRWQMLNLYAHQAAEPYGMRADTHRIVLTVGWRY
ncbi:MAG: hypothetical protein IKR37_03800 [Paludibacteraceae bacterium]|nr:hypothetical protein [Paludibacteraceae bacterium]